MTSLARQRQQRSMRVDRDLAPRPGLPWRRELGIDDEAPIDIPSHVLAAQSHHNGLWPIDLTSALCGDPLPGESAYERGPEVTIAPYDPAQNYVPYQAGISPREKLRQLAQIKHSSRDGRRRLAQTKGEGNG